MLKKNIMNPIPHKFYRQGLNRFHRNSEIEIKSEISEAEIIEEQEEISVEEIIKEQEKNKGKSNKK